MMRNRRWLAPDGAGGGTGGSAETRAPEGGALASQDAQAEKSYTQAQLDAAVEAAVQKAVAARVKEMNAAHARELEAKDLDHALRGALIDAHDADLVMGLLDKSKLKLNNGKVEGLDGQLSELRKAKSFLFAQKEPSRPAQLTGAAPADAGGKAVKGPVTYTREQIAAMSPQEINAHWADVSASLGK